MPKESRTSNPQRTSPILSGVQLPPSQSRPAAIWSAEDDEVLTQARASGLNWQPIATKHFPSKTANACRKRHERLMERKNAENFEGVKLEELAREYMAVRQKMWEMLATRVGEKWQTVEQKCMEKGLKNLQAAYRSLQRKERGMEEGDSGIGCSDAENELDDGRAEARQKQQQEASSSSQRGAASIQFMLSPAHEP